MPRYLSLFCVVLLTALTFNRAAAQCTIVDVDLTKGQPADKRLTISGGQWEQGWRVAGDLDRIVIDAGYEIKNGYLEVVVARRGGVTFAEGARKRNWLGLFACDTMNQCPGGYARAGGEGYAFSKAEIFSSKQPNTICEKKFGEYVDWTMDDKTEHTVRAQVRNNVMTWTSKVGAKTGQTACGDETQPVTHFRYATIGGILTEKKGWHHGSLVGLRVLRVTMVDADKAAGCKPPQPATQKVAGVVFDTDLTKGLSAFAGTVRGGAWDGGWRVTGNDQRLVWDAGYPVKNGRFEFWLTADEMPASPLTEFRGKVHHPDVHWAGVSGIADLATMKKHVFALRLGQKTEGMSKGHGWSKIVVLGANNEGETEKTEQVIGDYAWWKPLADGKKIIHFKIEWQDGLASLYLPDGSQQSCRTKGKLGNEVLISGLRYAWVGGIDEELKTAIPGMRFLRARLVDLDKPGAVAPQP